MKEIEVFKRSDACKYAYKHSHKYTHEHAERSSFKLTHTVTDTLTHFHTSMLVMHTKITSVHTFNILLLISPSFFLSPFPIRRRPSG